MEYRFDNTEQRKDFDNETEIRDIDNIPNTNPSKIILNNGGSMKDNKIIEKNELENDETITHNHAPFLPYKRSKFTDFLNIAYPVGITILSSTSLGFGLYETLAQSKDLAEKPEALWFISFTLSVMSALLLMALFHGYKNAIRQEYLER